MNALRKKISDTEQALHTSKEQYRTLLANIPGAAYRCELQAPWRVHFMSDGVEAIMGHTAEAFLRGEVVWGNLIVPEDMPEVEQIVNDGISNQTPYEIEYRIHHADGSIRWVFERGRAVYDAKNQPLHLDGVILDVTARKLAEEERRESETRFLALANAAPVLIWISGTDKRCTWFNQQWLIFTGRSLEQEYGNGWTEGVHAEDFKRCLEIYTSNFDQHTAFEMEYRLRRADGEFRWILDRGVPRFHPNGKFLGYIGSCIDITDYKRIMKELRESDQCKDEFIATLGHELRNPLAPLRSSLHILRRLPETGSASATRVYDMMERQVTHLVHLVDDLLEVSRITRGKIDLRKERTDLITSIHNAVEMARPLIEAAGHQLTLTLPPEPLTLEADPARLAQVFANLLNNAAKYTSEGGHIWFTAWSEGGEAVVSVQDNGVGIPAEMLPRVFDMFTQIDRTQQRSQGGLGIGLTLVQSLVQMHDGRVEAKSAGAGQGSEFLVHLPLAPALPDMPKE